VIITTYRIKKISDDHLAITGAEAEVDRQLQRLADLGVTEFWPIIFPAGDDPASSRHATKALLTRLAAAS
jgi:hypothetical protein